MASLKSLKRPSKWRANIRAELDQSIERGVIHYGVRKDGKYVVKSRSGEKILHRDVKGSMVAKSVSKA